MVNQINQSMTKARKHVPDQCDSIRPNGISMRFKTSRRRPSKAVNSCQVGLESCSAKLEGPIMQLVWNDSNFDGKRLCMLPMILYEVLFSSMDILIDRGNSVQQLFVLRVVWWRGGEGVGSTHRTVGILRFAFYKFKKNPMKTTNSCRQRPTSTSRNPVILHVQYER